MKLTITIFSIIITVFGYILSRKIFNKYKIGVLNPVFLTTSIVIACLLLLGLDFEDYKPAKEIMTFLLGPATVALALPLYNNRKALLSGLIPVLIGVSIGSLTNMLIVFFIGKIALLDKKILLSLLPKSITAPIAIEVSKIIGGDPALAAAFVVATGMIGAIIGPALLTLANITNPVARGLAIGTTAHGQGTAVALQEGETQGAMSGVAMAIAAVLTAILAPLLILIFQYIKII